MFRKQVRGVYRDLVRMIYKSYERVDLMAHARHEFRVHAGETELAQRKYLLNNGIGQINQMLPMIGFNKSLDRVE